MASEVSEKRVGKSPEPEKRQGRMRSQPGTEYIPHMGTTLLVASVPHRCWSLLVLLHCGQDQGQAAGEHCLGWLCVYLTLAFSQVIELVSPPVTGSCSSPSGTYSRWSLPGQTPLGTNLYWTTYEN